MDEFTRQAKIRDINLLLEVFSPNVVRWSKNLKWVKIKGYRLPPFYNRPSTDILIIWPPHYGRVNKSLEEFYMSKSLKIRVKGRGWQNIPHYHSRINKHSIEGWAWYCIHPRNWQETDNILVFIKLMELLLQDPLKERT